MLYSEPGTLEKPRIYITAISESLQMQFPSLGPSGHHMVFTQVNPGSRMAKAKSTYHFVRALF